MEPPINDDHALPTTTAVNTLPRSHLQNQGQRVIVLTEENFFKTLDDLFQYAERPQCRSWEAHLYRPWGYVFSSWCLAFSRPRMSLTCGAQWPFLHRVGGPENKVLGFVYPDFVLLLPNDGHGEIFLIVEIKPLSRAGWNTEVSKRRAATSLTKAMAQTRIQARMAFLQHEDQLSIQAFLACGVWWFAIRYSRSEVLSEDPPAPGSSANNSSSKSRKKRPPRRSRRNKHNKKTKGSRDSTAHEDDARPSWLDAESGLLSSSEDNGDSDGDPDGDSDSDDRRGGELGHDPNVLQLRDPEVARRAIYHIMQLGASTKALNPWFKAFLASIINQSPDISISDFQNSWFDQTEEERRLGYIWRDVGRPHDEGFAADFELPEGDDLPVKNIDDPSYGIDFLVQVDSEPNGSNNPIAINKDANTGLPSLTSPDLRLPEQFDFLLHEDLDMVATVLSNRMKTKKVEGYQLSDLTTPKTSTAHKSFTLAPTRPAQHTVHAADRKILPLPRSSAFNSDVPIPSSPSPRDRQRDHDGFVIPSLPSRHDVMSTQGFPLNLATDVPKSALGLAERSHSRQFAAYGTQPSSAMLEVFRQADKANRTPRKNQARNVPAPRLNTDSESPASRPRGRDPTAAAQPLREYGDPFAAASDLPSHQRSPRARAHSVVGITNAARPYDFASDAAPTTPRASGSRFGTSSLAQRLRDELDISSDASTSGVEPPHARPPRSRPEARVIPFPRSQRGEFRLRSTNFVVEIPMTLKFRPSKRQQESEQQQEASGSGSGSRDTPWQRDEDGTNDDEAGSKGKGKGRAGS